MTAWSSRPGFGESHASVTFAAAWAVAALLWTVNTTYRGIYHDAIVYALLAARWLDPAAFAHELFFLGGAQDAFNLFTPLLGTLVQQAGLDAAARLVVVAGGTLWLAGCFASARAMFDRTWLVVLAFLLCATLKLSYSPNFSTFTYNENFATARSLALPLGLCALAAMVAGRQALFWLLAAASVAIHPLHGIWLPVLYIAVRMSPKQLAFALGVGVLVLAGGIAFALKPLDLMAPAWAITVKASSSDVFSGGWESLRLSDILLVIGTLWLGGRAGSPALRQLFLRLAWLTAMAMLLFVVCSEFLPVRFVMQAQPWRVLWLAQVVAILAVVDLLGLAARRGQSHVGVALLLLAVAWGVPMLRPLIPFALILLHRFPARGDTVRRLATHMARPSVVAVALLAVAAILAPVYWVSLGIAGNTIATPLWQDQPELRGFLLVGGEGLALLGFAAALRWRPVAWAALLLAVPVLAWHAWHWDVRPAAMKSLEGMYLDRNDAWPWPGLPIRRGEVVAWYPRSMAVWAILRTPFYASTRQAIGIVFSEPKAVEIRRRLERMAVAKLMRDDMPVPRVDVLRQQVRAELLASGHDPLDLHKYREETLSAAGAEYLCADPVLDWVIVSHRTVGGHDGVPFDPGRVLGGAQFAHDCRQVRARPPTMRDPLALVVPPAPAFDMARRN